MGLGSRQVGSLGVIVVGMIGIVLAVAEAAPTRAASPEGSRAPRWTAHIKAMDDALARRDVRAAERAWHEAYLAALGSWRWEGMIEIGNANLRIGEVSGRRQASEAKARNAYLAALFRARALDSVDGVLRAAEAFAALGDREVVRQCVRIAERLASEDPDARARVSAFAGRLAALLLGTKSF